MLIRQAKLDDAESIVLLHIAAFEGFFLTRIGPAFLKKMYLAFINEPSGLMQVAIDEKNNIVGFAAGTVEPELFFLKLRKTQWLFFLFAAVPGIIKNPVIVIKKLFFALFYKGDKPVALEKAALLSSIAVLPEMAGNSIGKLLLNDFEIQVEKLNCKFLYLTTDKFGNDNVVAFYKRAGYQVESEFAQPDGRQMLRLIKYFKN